ncbi:MAG: HK97 gp10 family phage protein [Clostridia bacterium]|nr:HK97 gp10 family phage protein [Clostridia bacterium]
MAARKTPVEKLNSAIIDILSEYEADIQGNLERIVPEIGKKGVQALKAEARKKLNQDTGEYVKSWKYQVNKQRLSTTVTIYNDHPGLPHLLEYGHVTRNGTKRTFPPTPAHPHIAPVADELVETFEREVVSKL